MNIVHLHLLLNHIPVIGAVFGTLLLAVALLRRSGELAKTSLAFLALIGAMGVFVYLTGEPAQEAVEKLSGFSERLVDRHEDAAVLATIITGTIGALALTTLIIYRRRPVPRRLMALILVCAVGSSAAMGYTGYLGGQIRHSEIRPASAGLEQAPPNTADSDHDER